MPLLKVFIKRRTHLHSSSFLAQFGVKTFFANMKKLLLMVFIFTVLLLQAWGEASSVNDDVNSAASSQEESTDATTDGIKRYHPKQKINCNVACSKRCSKSSRKNVCHRACNTCCQRCHCVPPGTSGHTSACPCYASLRTHGNRPKCP